MLLCPICVHVASAVKRCGLIARIAVVKELSGMNAGKTFVAALIQKITRYVIGAMVKVDI